MKWLIVLRFWFNCVLRRCPYYATYLRGGPRELSHREWHDALDKAHKAAATWYCLGWSGIRYEGQMAEIESSIQDAELALRCSAKAEYVRPWCLCRVAV